MAAANAARKDDVDFAEALAQYKQVLRDRESGGGGGKRKRKGGGEDGIAALDDWFFGELGESARSRKYLTKDELLRVLDFKLLRGEFRIGLKAKVASNSEESVESTTRAVVAKLVNPEKGPIGEDAIRWCVTALDKGHPESDISGLSGVGPATALIILSALDDTVPYFSDEAGRYVSENGKVVYSIRSCIDLVNSLRKRATELGPEWTARDVEKAIYAHSNQSKAPTSKQETVGDKKLAKARSSLKRKSTDTPTPNKRRK